MKTPIIYILLLFTILSCKKDENETANITVTGRAVQDCAGTPLANQNIEAWVKLSGTCLSLTGCTDVIYTTTDANGNFSFTTKKGSMEIRLKGSNTILYGIPVNDNVNLGTFNAFPTTSFVYSIKANNPYNVGDTLYANLRSPFTLTRIIISAPLKDTLFNLTTFSGVSIFPIPNNIEIKVDYAVTHDNPNIPSNWYITKTYFYNSLICNSNNDTLTIEIN